MNIHIIDNNNENYWYNIEDNNIPKEIYKVKNCVRKKLFLLEL